MLAHEVQLAKLRARDLSKCERNVLQSICRSSFFFQLDAKEKHGCNSRRTQVVAFERVDRPSGEKKNVSLGMADTRDEKKFDDFVSQALLTRTPLNRNRK